jgi:hypothetical protein
MAAASRREFDDIISVMMYDSSSDSSSDSDDDLDLLLVENLFPSDRTKPDTPRLNLEDLTETQCEQMFR